jgi:threonine/homoserine/homoserine lactone efflux protein
MGRSRTGEGVDATVLLRGVALGFSVAAPVGPVGVLCIRRTLADGRVTGFVTGLGAATADAFYGGVAAFGLTFVTRLLLGEQVWLRVVGGLFLCYLGIKTLRSRPAETETSAARSSLFSAYFSTLALTLTNPLTILSFAAIFAGFGGLVNAPGAWNAAALLVSGVFAGSALWWLLLAGGVGLVRGAFDRRRLVHVNRASGAINTVFGVVALAGLLVR